MHVGLDLGGTKIELVALQVGTMAELGRERVATPRGYEATIEALVALVRRAESRHGEATSVGIGIPGTISPHRGTVKNANSTWLNGHPLDRDLATALGRPVVVANDANCFVLSEAADGAAAGAATVFGVILGTGVGGGIVSAGHLLIGPNAIAGEWGHNPLPRPGPDEQPGPSCSCGRRGCIEAFLSGPALAADHRRHGGRETTVPQIAAAARRGDEGARATLTRHAERLGRALAGIINILDPDVIVLGGGLSNLPHLYEDVPRYWTPHVFSDHIATRLLPAKHGDSSGVRGAAWLGAAAPRAGAPARPIDDLLPRR